MPRLFFLLRIICVLAAIVCLFSIYYLFSIDESFGRTIIDNKDLYIEGEINEVSETLCIKNNHLTDMEIRLQSQSCSCTKIELPLCVTPPGKSAKAVIKTNLIGKAGKINASMSVINNFGEIHNKLLTCFVFPRIQPSIDAFHLSCGAKQHKEEKFQVVHRSRVGQKHSELSISVNSAIKDMLVVNRIKSYVAVEDNIVTKTEDFIARLVSEPAEALHYGMIELNLSVADNTYNKCISVKVTNNRYLCPCPKEVILSKNALSQDAELHKKVIIRVPVEISTSDVNISNSPADGNVSTTVNCVQGLVAIDFAVKSDCVPFSGVATVSIKGFSVFQIPVELR